MVLQLALTEPIEPHPLAVAIVVADGGARGEGESEGEGGGFFGVVMRKNSLFRSPSNSLTFSNLKTPAPSITSTPPLDHRSSFDPITPLARSPSSLLPYDLEEIAYLALELKRLTFNAPIAVVPLPDLSSLCSELSLLCIVAHTAIFDATIRSLPSPPYALMSYSDGELELVDLVLQPRKKKRKRR